MNAKIDWDDFISKDEIIRLYYSEQWGVNKLAEYIGVGVKSLLDYMDLHGLPRRSRESGRENKLGPPCPFCGNRKSKIIFSSGRKERPLQYRRRKCLECGKYFGTKEVVLTKSEISSFGEDDPIRVFTLR